MRQGKKGSLEECSRSKTKKKKEDYHKSLATTAL